MIVFRPARQAVHKSWNTGVSTYNRPYDVLKRITIRYQHAVGEELMSPFYGEIVLRAYPKTQIDRSVINAQAKCSIAT